MKVVDTFGLQGINIVELTHLISGPYAGKLLAHQGASCIKIERPEFNDSIFDVPHGNNIYKELNQGKDLVYLDINRPLDLSQALDFIYKADVVIENFSPGSLEKKGLIYSDIAKVNEKLIYCSISGFGSKDYRNGHRGAYDNVIQAAAGMMILLRGDSSKPSKVDFPLIDTTTGLMAFGAICSALLERQKSGLGQYIEISMIKAAQQLLYPVLCNAYEPPLPVERYAKSYFRSIGSRYFECLNGWLVVSANTSEQVSHLCEVLDVSNADNQASLESEALGLLIENKLKEIDVFDAERKLISVDVPVSRIRSMAEFVSDEFQLELTDFSAKETYSKKLSALWRNFRSD